jgi:hypothetical protein
MATARPPATAIRSLVRAVVECAPAEVRAPLLAQADAVDYVNGPVTMMRLRVEGDPAPARCVASPVPGGPHVFNAEGDAIGGLILWLDAGGYIECLEYWWVTDDMPTELPSRSQVRRS